MHYGICENRLLKYSKNMLYLQGLVLLLHGNRNMYRYHHNLLPPGLPNNNFAVQSDIHSYNTKQALDLHIDSTNTKLIKLAENTIKIKGPIIWNLVNKTTKYCRSLASFKKSLKKQILAQYSSNVTTNKYAPLS